MSFRFANPSRVPPGGIYFYEIRAAFGVVRFEGKSLEDVVEQVEVFCDANSLPRDLGLRQKIIDFMCQRLPPDFCEPPGGQLLSQLEGSVAGVRPRKRLSISQVFDMTRLLFRRLRMSPRVFLASEEEAESRARICVACPLNRTDICTSVCSGALAVVRSLVGRRETSLDVGLGVCEVCGCLLKAKVHVSGVALREAVAPPPKDQLPEFCWLRDIYYSGSGENAT